VKHLAKVVEVGGDLFVFGDIDLLVDGQKVAHQRLGLCQTVRAPHRFGVQQGLIDGTTWTHSLSMHVATSFQ
jgi:hypothetical protein